MPVRLGPVDLGNDDARAIAMAIGNELREARLALGLSRRSVARSAGVSASNLARIERCLIADPPLPTICRVSRVLGMQPSLKLYPAGVPVRDAAHLSLLGRFEALLGGDLRFRREVPLPNPEDLRTWDGAVISDREVGFTEGETRLGDGQALARRLGLKLRDDPRGTCLLLAVSRSRHNLAVLREHRESLRHLLPLDGAAIARALRAGRLPPASGIIVL
jgi:transcriptional regulator with XRE-family HTH domain